MYYVENTDWDGLGLCTMMISPIFCFAYLEMDGASWMATEWAQKVLLEECREQVVEAGQGRGELRQMYSYSFRTRRENIPPL